MISCPVIFLSSFKTKNFLRGHRFPVPKHKIFFGTHRALEIKVIIGEIIKTILLARVGTITSLNNNLTASAIGCNRPNGPTTLGPLLICIRPITLLSA
jgi:hypothetical protein